MFVLNAFDFVSCKTLFEMVVDSGKEDVMKKHPFVRYTNRFITKTAYLKPSPSQRISTAIFVAQFVPEKTEWVHQQPPLWAEKRELSGLLLYKLLSSVYIAYYWFEFWFHCELKLY